MKNVIKKNIKQVTPGDRRSTVNLGAPKSTATAETVVAAAGGVAGCPEDIPCYPLSETEAEWQPDPTGAPATTSFNYSSFGDNYPVQANYNGDVFWALFNDDSSGDLVVARWAAEQDLDTSPNETDYVTISDNSGPVGFFLVDYRNHALFFNKWNCAWGSAVRLLTTGDFLSQMGYYDSINEELIVIPPDTTYSGVTYQEGRAAFGPEEGDVYMMMTETEITEFATYHRYMLSKNGAVPTLISGWSDHPGDPWSGWEINPSPGHFAMDVDSLGTIHVVGSVRTTPDEMPPHWKLMYAYSTDDGATWSDDIPTPYVDLPFIADRRAIFLKVNRYGHVAITAQATGMARCFVGTTTITEPIVIWDIPMEDSSQFFETTSRLSDFFTGNSVFAGMDPCGCRFFFITAFDDQKDEHPTHVPTVANIIDNGPDVLLGAVAPLASGLPNTWTSTSGNGVGFTINGRVDLGYTIVGYPSQDQGFFRKVVLPD